MIRFGRLGPAPAGRLFALLALALAGLAPALQPQAAVGRAAVHVIPIEGVIDLGLAPFVRRALDQATAEGAAAVVLQINTFGGRVDAAVQIRDALLAARVPTVAFIDRRAISAGALIALSCERIAMTSGGTIGAATPVQAGQPGAAAQPADEKTVSYVRKEFRATAEARKRPPVVAEAMVDADVEIPGLVQKGKLLTLTTEEALQQKIADLRAEDFDSLLRVLALEGAPVRRDAPNWAENAVRTLTHPVTTSLLLSVGLLGILIELRTPGFGLAGAAGLLALGLFFWGHWIVQLAGWEEVLLVGGGVVLLAVEMFVIPGFGIAGILGILSLVAGLVLALSGGGASAEFLVRATTQVVLSLLAALIAGLVLLRFLPRLPGTRRLVLDAGLPAGDGTAAIPPRWLGRRGITSTSLRPAGIAVIDGERVDVVSNGESIDPGEPVEVVHVDGNRVVVRRATTPRAEEQQ